MTPTRLEFEEAIAEGIRRARLETKDERRDEISDAVQAGVAKGLGMIDLEARKDALKAAYKDLVREWAADFSIWALRGIGAFIIGSMIFLALYVAAIKAGWAPPK